MFIDDIGRSYANDNLSGAYFLHEGRVLRLNYITGNEIEALDTDTDSTVILSKSVITGWRTFKYPRLGWRRAGDVVFHCERAPRSYTRGLSQDNIIIDPSENTISTTFGGDYDDWEYFKEDHFNILMKAALSPTYDGRDRWNDLINGTARDFVPRHDTIFSKLGDGKIAVGVMNIRLGYYTPSGKIVANPTNTAIIEKLVRTYAR